MNLKSSRLASSPLVIAVALTCPLIAGCEVDQKKEVATYRQVLDGPKPPVFQYTAGEPLTLEAALLLANRNDEQLASSGEDYLQALIDKERQFAVFLPTLSLAPSYSWVDHRGSVTSFNGQGGVSTTSEPQGQTQVPLVSNYTLFNGFANVANFRRAGYTSQERQALLMDLQQTILLNVAQAYYSVLTNERSVVVLLNSVSVQNERVRDMRGRMAAGVARPLDVAQTEANAAATRVQLIQAQNNVRTGRIALAFLTSSEVQDAPLDDRVKVPDRLLPADEALKSAEKTRQDVQASESAIEAARQSLQAAIAEYYPTISLNIQYFLEKGRYITPADWETIFQANLPIFSGGSIHADVRTGWSQLRQAWLNQQRTRRQVAEQVRTAYENLAGSKKRINDLRVEVAAARDALEQSQFSYQAGLATNLDVLTATDQLLSAQLSLVTEELNYKVYFLQLLRSQGILARPDSPLPSNPPASHPTREEITTPGLNVNPNAPAKGQPASNPASAAPAPAEPATQATAPTTAPAPTTRP